MKVITRDGKRTIVDSAEPSPERRQKFNLNVVEIKNKQIKTEEPYYKKDVM